jgi:hypothetical protein
MPLIKLDSAQPGDILTADLKINQVVLFESGTVLTNDRLEILRSLGISSVNLEDRTKSQFSSMKDSLVNIDRRFSYVEDKPFMMTLKAWVKDILSNLRGKSE